MYLEWPVKGEFDSISNDIPWIAWNHCLNELKLFALCRKEVKTTILWPIIIWTDFEPKGRPKLFSSLLWAVSSMNTFESVKTSINAIKYQFFCRNLDSSGLFFNFCKILISNNLPLGIFWNGLYVRGMFGFDTSM